MFMCCGCCVLSGRGLCDGLIIRSEESYRLWCIVVCDHETSQARRLKPARAGMSNMRPFASTTAARTKDTVIWSFNGQNCSFYNLNWINVRRSQKNSMLFFIQDVFYTWKYDFY